MTQSGIFHTFVFFFYGFPYFAASPQSLPLGDGRILALKSGKETTQIILLNRTALLMTAFLLLVQIYNSVVNETPNSDGQLISSKFFSIW